MKGLDLMDRFVRWILEQLKTIFLKFDFNKNLQFEPE